LPDVLHYEYIFIKKYFYLNILKGLTRFATEIYEPPNKDNLGNLMMHLTNYAINRDNPNFKFNDDSTKMDVGHKKSLTAVFNMLKE